MKPQTPRFALLVILPAWLAMVLPTPGQDTGHPVTPPSAVPAEPSSAPAATSSSPTVIKLPPFDVTAPKEQPPSTLKQTFEKLNHVFEGPFPSLRSGPLIEAILWRHHYLTEHPSEKAVIVTSQRGERILSATTVYTKEGKVYGSSNALGENLPIKGLTAAGLNNPAGLARAKKYIAEYRAQLPSLPAGSPLSGSVDAISGLLVSAEDSGDYSILVAAAGQANQFVQSDESSQLGHDNAGIQGQWNKANYYLGQSAVQAFAEPAAEILSWTYQALHNPTQAGILPVALTQVRVKSAIMTISPFETNNIDPAKTLESHDAIPERDRDIISEKSGVARNVEALVFDWEGVQYLYQPDIGTQAKPLPLNSVTGLPYLCVKNGELMECAYFCATYAQQHPDEKAVLVPGDPVLAAYQHDGKLGLFIPALGRFTLPKDYWDLVNDNASLAQLRDQFVLLQKQKGQPSDVIPQAVAGDDADLQMRRAFRAFQAAGITCLLQEEAEPSLHFTWDGTAYVYGSDQQVRLVPAE